MVTFAPSLSDLARTSKSESTTLETAALLWPDSAAIAATRFAFEMDFSPALPRRDGGAGSLGGSHSSSEGFWGRLFLLAANYLPDGPDEEDPDCESDKSNAEECAVQDADRHQGLRVVLDHVRK